MNDRVEEIITELKDILQTTDELHPSNVFVIKSCLRKRIEGLIYTLEKNTKHTATYMWLSHNGLTEGEMDFMWEACKVYKHPVISRLSDWRDLRVDLVAQIPKIYEECVNKVLYGKRKNDE